MSENLTVWDQEHTGIASSMKSWATHFGNGSLTAMNGIKRVKGGKLHGVSDWWRKGELDGY